MPWKYPDGVAVKQGFVVELKEGGILAMTDGQEAAGSAKNMRY